MDSSLHTRGNFSTVQCNWQAGTHILTPFTHAPASWVLCFTQYNPDFLRASLDLHKFSKFKRNNPAWRKWRQTSLTFFSFIESVKATIFLKDTPLSTEKGGSWVNVKSDSNWPAAQYNLEITEIQPHLKTTVSLSDCPTTNWDLLCLNPLGSGIIFKTLCFLFIIYVS